MIKEIKRFVTIILCKVWKRPLVPLVNKGTTYIGGKINQDMYSDIREIREDETVQYPINFIMLKTIEYLCDKVIHTDRIWPARYSILINVREDIALYIVPHENAKPEEYSYMPNNSMKAIYPIKFGALEVLCSYQESNLLALSNEEITVFILDKWWAIAYKYFRWYYYAKAFIIGYSPVIIPMLIIVLLLLIIE